MKVTKVSKVERILRGRKWNKVEEKSENFLKTATAKSHYHISESNRVKVTETSKVKNMNEFVKCTKKGLWNILVGSFEKNEKILRKTEKYRCNQTEKLPPLKTSTGKIVDGLKSLSDW